MKLKKILYYKELSKIINNIINSMRFCNSKNNDIIKRYYYYAGNEIIEYYFDHGRISCDAYEYFRKRVNIGYWS